MMKLTKMEIEAVLEVAGDALPFETLQDPELTNAQNSRRVMAFERGMLKLKRELTRMNGASTR